MKREDDVYASESAMNHDQSEKYGKAEVQENSTNEEKSENEISDEDESDSSDLEEWLDSVI